MSLRRASEPVGEARAVSDVIVRVEDSSVSEAQQDYRVRLLRRRGARGTEPSRTWDAEKWRSYFRKNKRRWSRFLPKDPAARILEIGCGDGSFVRFLREMGYSRAEGLDVSEERLARAQGLGAKDVFQADLRTYFSDRGIANDLDVVFALNVIEHLRKDEVLTLLTDVFSALRPGGEFWIRTPNGAGLFAGYTRYVEFTHENAFTTASLREILEFAGFREMRFRPWGPVPHGVVSLARYLGWRTVELALSTVSLLETASAKGGIFTADLLACARKPPDGI